MGLIGALVKLPLAPLTGTVWIAEQIQAQAEAEYYDEGAIQAQLREIDEARQRRDDRRRGRRRGRGRADGAAAGGTGAMSDGGSDGKLSARDLTLAAKATVEDLTGNETETVSALQSDGENWLVTVEVCELERVPNTTDVMASYVVQLDDAGGLLGYRRERRYLRGEAEQR